VSASTAKEAEGSGLFDSVWFRLRLRRSAVLADWS
jgi:hypothetical protein